MPAINADDEILLNHIRSQAPSLSHNKDILCILEGDLLSFIEQHLRQEFSAESFKSIEPRISPINFLKRIIDKLSKIYQQPVQRVEVDGSDSDQELVDMYVNSMNMNSIMNTGNEYFNAFKTNLNQIYLDDLGFPKLRAIPNDRFTVFSDNKIDQTVPTHVILPFGQNVIKAQYPEQHDRVVDVFKVFTDEQIYLLDLEGNKSAPGEMNPGGENPFGTLPFMYANRSNSFLIPPIDSDTKRMTILLPVLVSDLNYAVKYQAFSIIWLLNADAEEFKQSPNVVWTLKQDPGVENKPEVGQIKPQVDITQVIELITTQLSMWLNSRNIRPGSVSDLSASDPVSGISKLVDEMDTSDERKKQVEVYKNVEQKFWNDVIHKIHPVWLSQGLLAPEFSRAFSSNVRVEVMFPEQLPMQRRGQIVKDISLEMGAGLISRESAMRKVNPEWSDKRLQEEMELIDSEVMVVEDEPEPVGADTGDDDTPDDNSGG